jgi:hypothetical protein
MKLLRTLLFLSFTLFLPVGGSLLFAEFPAWAVRLPFSDDVFYGSGSGLCMKAWSMC